MKTKRFKLNLACTLLMTTIGSAQALVTVGQTNDCDFDNILDAYLDVDVVVAVTNEVTYNDSFIISKAKVITGGYDSCANAESGILSETKTKWSRADDGTVIAINPNLAAPTPVLLSNLEIFGGDNTGIGESGGVSISGNTNVILTNSEIYNNQGENGGGIKITGEQASVTLNNSVVRDNNATEDGGGIYCQNQAHVTIQGLSSVNNNQASRRGGGLFANSACQITSSSGDDLAPALTQYGIRFNSAQFGGGVYLDSGASMNLTGNNEHPASFVFNLATMSNGDGGEGGGMYIIGKNTMLTAVNARIDANLAISYGAGIAISEGAEMSMGRLNSHCWDNNRCSSLSDNILTGGDGSGGAIDIYSDASVSIAQTKMTGNTANDVAVVNVEFDSSLRLEGNLITGSSDWNDDSETVLFQADGGNTGSQIDFFYNTLIDNSALTIFNLDPSSQHTLKIHNSILNHSGLTLNQGGSTNNFISTDCVFLSESGSLTGNIGAVLLTDPGFVDAANGNYRLKADSDAIDLCDESLFGGSNFNDFNGQTRGYDDPSINNFLGPYDAGAYEFNDDLIFKNSFD